MVGYTSKHELILMGWILLVVMVCGSANAQEKTKTLETVTVTAERFPVKEKESDRFVTVYQADELKETGANNLVDALKRKGGFSYKAFGPLGISHGGMNSKLSIRGLENGELVLINGTPIQGVAGHAYDLDTISVDQIERVEILKGAASTLYGADAMTGVINIITKKNPTETSVKVYSEVGDHEYHNHGVSLLGPKLNLGINYSHMGYLSEISRSFSDNYRYATDPVHKYSANININPFEDFFIDYIGSFYRTGFKKKYDSGALEGTDQDQYKHLANIRYEKDFLRLKAFCSYTRMMRDEYTDPSEPDDDNRNHNAGMEGDYRFNLYSTEFVIGSDYVYRAADYNNKYGKHYRNDIAAFIQVKKKLFESITVTLGARQQFIEADSDGTDHNIFLPSIGINYKTTHSLNLFANTGKAFRAPTFNNLYYSSSFLIGNPDLDPEEGWTYEGGMKYDNDALRLRLAAFFMDYSDKIEIDRSGGYPLTYFNAGDYNTKGIEWETDIFPFYASTGFIQNISFHFSGYWADPSAEDTSGDEYQAGPKFQGATGLSYVAEKMTLDFLCSMLQSRERDLDDYATLNFYGKFKLFKGFLTLSVDNIFDEEVHVSGDMRPDASSQYVYYDLPRLYKVGYEITF